MFKGQSVRSKQLSFEFDPPHSSEANEYWGPLYNSEIYRITEKNNIKGERFLDWITPWVRSFIYKDISSLETAVIMATIGADGTKEVYSEINKTVEEIAYQLILSESSVKSAIYRLKKKKILNSKGEVVPLLREWLIFRHNAHYEFVHSVK